MQSKMNSHSLLVGMQNGTAISEDSLAISYKAKHALTVQSSYYTTCLGFTQMSGNLWLHRRLHMDVYSSLIYNYQDLEATKMPFSRWLDNVIYD